MIESFVDLTYRGLSLGRRVKLSQVRPSTGYLETPAPMPVGTLIQIATDEGITLEAAVTGIHEQTGGSDKAPGMTVTPKLAGEASESWWRARVAYPDEVKAAPAITRTPPPVTVRPRSHTTPEPLAMATVVEPDQAATDVIPVVAEGKPTMIMPAVDQELLESLSRPSGEIEQLVRSTGEHEIVDDGKRTTIMDAIDPASLGLDFGTGNSGTFPAVTDEDSGPTSTNGNGDDKKSGGAKKKRKRR